MPIPEMSYKDYDGPFFIGIQTGFVLTDTQLTSKLNENSKRIVHDYNRPGITTWEMNDLSASLKVVLLLQEKQCPFTLEGSNGILFMESFA
jgi:hypothetical protein